MALVCASPTIGDAQTQATRIHPVVCEPHLPVVAPSLAWRGDVVRWAEWPVQLSSAAVRARIMIVKVPARRMHFLLAANRVGNTIAPWSIATAPADVNFAANAGQFTDDGPWGWVVHNGRELQSPGSGPLAGALVVDSSGAVEIVTARDIRLWRSPLRVREAVQSYPILLEGKGQPPNALCNAASGVDLTHRDTRLAVGTTRTGDVIFALSQFEVPGGVATRIPIGPTTPEMAEILRQLGAVRALMLDGGLSAQMLVRSGADSAQWPGLRDVPLALVGRLK